MHVLTLTVIQGPETGKRFELPVNEPQLIGRSSEALPIGDDTVSRRHAELTPDNGIWWIRDLKSQNGTYINGVRVFDRTRLHPGDQIRVGSSVMTFGESQDKTPDDVVRLMREREMDIEVEHRLASNEDSMIMAEPEPARAAVDHLRVIYQLTTLTSQITDKRELVGKVLDLVFEEFKPERGVVMLSGATPDAELEPAAVKYRSPPKDPEDAKIHVSRTIMRSAIKDGEGILSSNAMTDPRFKSGDSVQKYEIRSAISSPIKFRDHTFGAVYIDSSMANYTFTAEQLALMNAIGRHTGLALANAEATLEQLHTQRLATIGETVASLSHSIKNILQGLRGGADVTEMGLRKEDLKIAAGGWEILKRNLDRIVNLTMNMLAFSRQRTLELELTKLGPLVEECAQLLETRCEEKKVALIVDADPEMPPIAIDPNMLHQAVMNLLVNAVDAVEAETGAVTARVSFNEVEPGRVGTPTAEITVLDNGPGIPKDRLGWIFEPFNTTKGLKGTGLGLAVTKRIVDEHSGRIRVETQVGKGSAFRVFIPADLDSRHDPAATADDKPSAGELMSGL